ncbi:TolC family protein [Phycisphaeraceae bacterium AH-315-B13]|nr:TolC family protein [Phycisphaeraceae bacterium AH-315-B13]
MASQLVACALGAAAAGLLTGCSSPFDDRPGSTIPLTAFSRPDSPSVPLSRYRDKEPGESFKEPSLDAASSLDEYIRYALYHSAAVEAMYQRWLAATERVPQVGALPDPRLGFGFFLDEVETRTGAQHARVSLSQSFPWIGTLSAREDAASKAAMAEWQLFQASRLLVKERVAVSLYELAYLDSAIRITQENLSLLQSFEEVVRARYRVGTGSHPELIRVQVELGLLEDRAVQLNSMRPAGVAKLNASLNRPVSQTIPEITDLPGLVADTESDKLIEQAHQSSPVLHALQQRAEEQHYLAKVAQKNGLPDLTVGLDYIFTGEASDSSTPESGDDPILLSFGITLPVWRDKYDAGVRESIARRLSIAHSRQDMSNQIAAEISRAWFDHTDADRRVRLYEQTLIPKAKESLRSSLAGFRTGDSAFLDLLDTERTLLEFALVTERARADRGIALAKLNRLVGEPIPTRAASDTEQTETQR